VRSGRALRLRRSARVRLRLDRQALVVAELEVGLQVELKLVLERLRGVERHLLGVHPRVRGRLQVVLLDRVVVGVVQEVLDELAVDLLAEVLLEHLARHLAGPEALHPGPTRDVLQAALAGPGDARLRVRVDREPQRVGEAEGAEHAQGIVFEHRARQGADHFVLDVPQSVEGIDPGVLAVNEIFQRLADGVDGEVAVRQVVAEVAALQGRKIEIHVALEDDAVRFASGCLVERHERQAVIAGEAFGQRGGVRADEIEIGAGLAHQPVAQGAANRIHSTAFLAGEAA